MNRILLLLTALIFLCFKKVSPRPEEIILNRIEYIYNLKDWVDKNVWKGFKNSSFDVPLIDYTNDKCYIANPTEKFIVAYRPKLILNNNTLKIYTTSLLDSAGFHMENTMTFGNASSKYDFKSPYMRCSSFEITKNTVPGVNSTEQWITMLLHEYFHGFQFKHDAHLDYFEKKIISVPADSLTNIYRSQKWFKESVDKENTLLLSAIRNVDNNKTKDLIDSFFQYRQQRRIKTNERLKFDITPIEEFFETTEGTARYVEYSLYDRYANKQQDHKLFKTDTSYRSYIDFRNYNIEKDPWLYLSDKTFYYYAIGFNMARLMDRLKIDYKTRLFNEGGVSLEQLLKNHFRK